MNKMIRAVIALAILGLFSAQSFAQIRVNEVGYNGVDFEGATKWVELYNAGDTEVDISGLILCEPPAYPTLGSLTALAGSTTIPAGGYLVVAWSDIGDTDAEVGLYEAGTTNFADENTILDYMQYGNAGHAREVPAVAAGVWTAGEFVPNAEAGMSLQYVDNGTVGSGNWVAAAPTPNAENSAGNEGITDIRINEIGYNGVDFESAAKWVELYNAGETDVDVSNLILCDPPAYPVINTLTSLAGELVIPAGGYLVVAWSDLGDADGEVGLYKENSFGAFGSADNLIDYMQYGSAAHTREAPAVEAGLWTAGEFVANAEAGVSLQYVDNGTVGSGNWIAAAATPNAENNTATSNEAFGEVPGAFKLHANFPNPFNPTTTISYELNKVGQVSLSVFDMLGKKVADLYDGAQAVGSYSFSWDGRDERGSTVSSGVYFYRLTLDGRVSKSRVMTLLK